MGFASLNPSYGLHAALNLPFRHRDAVFPRPQRLVDAVVAVAARGVLG